MLPGYSAAPEAARDAHTEGRKDQEMGESGGLRRI